MTVPGTTTVKCAQLIVHASWRQSYDDDVTSKSPLLKPSAEKMDAAQKPAKELPKLQHSKWRVASTSSESTGNQ